MKIAVVQFCPVFGDKVRNIASLKKLVTQAAFEGAKLVVLPELATTGYSFMSREQAMPYAEVIDLSLFSDPETDHASSTMYWLARELHICIVMGLMERDPGTEKLYNSQIYVDPTGYLDTYRKINRWGNDFLWASPGTGNPPVIRSNLLEKRVGLLICRDIRDKKDDNWKNFYSPGDADIVAFSSNFGDGAFPATSWMEFAVDNKVCLAVSNRYAKEANNNFGEGGICVIHPDGKVDCDGLVWNQDCIVYSDV